MVFRTQIRRVIAKAVKMGCIAGAIGSFELAVGFLPLRVLPHLHLIVFSRGFSLEDARQIRRWLKQAIRKSRELECKLHPDVSVLRLPSPNDYRRALSYCFKRIKIEKAYAYAADRVDCEKGRMEMLNGEFDMLFDNIREVYEEIGNPVYRFGICNSRHKHVSPPQKLGLRSGRWRPSAAG